jgi:aminopeptidase N/puromycin-sensitive aminopeptidase
MNRNLILSVLLLACSGAMASAQRLPELAVPENYQLTFTPDFSNDKFAGEESIRMRVLKPTNQIVLNAAEIDFKQASVTANGSTQTATVTMDKEKEMATLAFGNVIQPGPAIVHIRYTGTLNSELRGFYLGKDKDGRKYAVTQFEATDARRAFPSFDEPAYKATYDVSVIADKGLTAISNGKVLSDQAGPGANQHTVKFATTAKMSSYLVALAVGDFEAVEGSADGIPIRVWGPPGSKRYSGYALEVAEQCLKYYNKYFGIKYPFEKLDMIGLPDFAAGAMENTGLITYREVLLQIDEKASAGLHKEVALVVAHEMAHQWFGDLVTMQWWDDIWLNEGFATWMESKAVGAWKPEWHIELDDVEGTQEALNVDSLRNTRPIHQPADTPGQILELFDGIAYGKTAAVLRMLEAYLGEESFRKGVDAYLKQHEYGNATAGDFWKTLAVESKRPVDEIMPTFVNQAGAPMVSVQAQCSGSSTNVELTQTRYFYDRTMFDKGSSELWKVPVCMKGLEGGTTQTKCVVLEQKQQSFPLEGCGPWVMVNAGARGYYRSGYSADALRALSRDLEKDLTAGERIVLLSDAWAAVRVGQQQIGDYLALAEGLGSDRTRAVIEELTQELTYISDHFVTDSDREAYEQWVRRLLAPAARELGWQAKPEESDETKELRSHVMFALGYAGRDPQVLAEARKLTETGLVNPSGVDHEMAFTAFRLAALEGDASLYDRVFAKLQNKEVTPEEYYLYFESLAQFRDPKLLQRTLEFAVSPTVRTQDSLGLISAVMRNPAGTRLAWDFVRTHWSDIEKVGGGFTSGEVVAATGFVCDAGVRDEVQDFFAMHRVPTAERRLKQAVERINYCLDLKTQQAPQLATWLQGHGGAAGAK